MIAGESIYAALFARLRSSVTLCKRYERKWFEPQQIDPDHQPALLCLEGHEVASNDGALPTSYVLEAAIVVYARTNDTDTPGTVLSNILDQIKAAFEPQGTDGWIGVKAHTTLGGLVDSAAIVGPIEKEDGALTGGQGWISLTVRIDALP